MRFFDFARRALHYFPRKLPAILTIQIIGSSLEGLGLALLIPVLQMAQGEQAETSSFISRMLANGLSLLGVPLTLASALLAFFCVFAFQNALTVLKETLDARIYGQFQLRLRHTLYRAILAAKWEVLISHRKGDLTNVITEEVRRAALALRFFLHMSTNTVLGFAYILIALLISWQFTIVLLLVGAVVVRILRRFLRAGAKLGQDVTNANTAFKNFTIEQLESAKLIKSSGLEAQALEESDRLSNRLSQLWVEGIVRPVWYKGLFEPITVGLRCIAIFVSLQVFGLQLTNVMVLLFIFYRLAPRLQQLNQSYFNLLLHAPGLFWSTLVSKWFARNRKAP